MSRHWKPDEKIARMRRPRAAAKQSSWPEGATAGLLVVAAACLAIATLVYEVAGPRDVFEEETSR